MLTNPLVEISLTFKVDVLAVRPNVPGYVGALYTFEDLFQLGGVVDIVYGLTKKLSKSLAKAIGRGGWRGVDCVYGVVVIDGDQQSLFDWLGCVSSLAGDEG